MEVRDLKYNYDNSSASISKTHDSLGTLYKYDLRLWQSSQKTGMTRFCQDLAHFYEYKEDSILLPISDLFFDHFVLI